MKPISILFLLLLSCSEDNLKIKCDCVVIKTTSEVVFVNGLPTIKNVRTERPYGSDCDADGFILSDNEIVKCN